MSAVGHRSIVTSPDASSGEEDSTENYMAPAWVFYIHHKASGKKLLFDLGINKVSSIDSTESRLSLQPWPAIETRLR